MNPSCAALSKAVQPLGPFTYWNKDTISQRISLKNLFRFQNLVDVDVPVLEEGLDGLQPVQLDRAVQCRVPQQVLDVRLRLALNQQEADDLGVAALRSRLRSEAFT